MRGSQDGSLESLVSSASSDHGWPLRSIAHAPGFCGAQEVATAVRDSYWDTETHFEKLLFHRHYAVSNLQAQDPWGSPKSQR